MKRRDIVRLAALAPLGALSGACATNSPPIPSPQSTGTPVAPITDKSASTSATPSAVPSPALAPTVSVRPTSVSAAPRGIQQSTLQRVTSPDVPSADLDALAAGNSAFAFDLYKALSKRNGNLFLSPYSISLAFAMTYAGAKARTAEQMAKTFHFTLPDDRLHLAFDALDLQLANRGQGAKGQDGKGFRLKVVNSTWGQAGYRFLSPYLDTLAKYYGAGLRTLDFVKEPEPSRVRINAWVKDQTEGKIVDLLAQDAITDRTRLVLTNAVYFNAAWRHPFEPGLTKPQTFTLLDGRSVETPMMKQLMGLRLPYAKAEGYQAVDLPYDGDELSMVIVLPDAGTFQAFEKALTADRMSGILRSLADDGVLLSVPKLDYGSDFDLPQTLAAMGMSDVFDSSQADLSGMTDVQRLFVDHAVHKAIVAVNEKGTEAAAATGVVIIPACAPPTQMVVNRPYVFLIRDVKMGTIVFVGRVLDPRSKT